MASEASAPDPVAGPSLAETSTTGASDVTAGADSTALASLPSAAVRSAPPSVLVPADDPPSQDAIASATAITQRSKPSSS